MTMLKAFMDKGARPDAGAIMCIGTALFKPTRYKQFCRKWEQLLADLGVPFLHATDFYCRAGLYRNILNADWHLACRRIPELIDEYATQLLSVSFRQREFEDVAPAAWRARFGSLHGIAVKVSLDALGYVLDERRNFEPVAYVLESGDATQAHVDRVLRKVGENSQARKVSRYRSHMFAGKGVERGLEVADCFAWHWNKFYAETVARPIREMRQDLHAMIDGNPAKYRVYLFTGDTLRQFLINHGCYEAHPARIPADDPNESV